MSNSHHQDETGNSGGEENDHSQHEDHLIRPYGYYEEIRRLLAEQYQDDPEGMDTMDSNDFFSHSQFKEYDENGDVLLKHLQVQDLSSHDGATNPYLLHTKATTTLTNNADSTTNRHETFQFLNLAVAIGLSQPSQEEGGEDVPLKFYYGICAAMLLAAHDFNTHPNHGGVAPDLHTLLNDDQAAGGRACPQLKLLVDFYDSKYPQSPTKGAAVLRQVIHQRPYPYQPAAVVGAIRSRVSMPLALLNSFREIPQVSFASTSTELDNAQSYPYFARTIPSSIGDVKAVGQFLQHFAKSTHVVILYMQDDTYATTYRLALEQECTRLGISTQAVGLFFFRADHQSVQLKQSVAAAVKTLKSIGYRHFVAIVSPNHLHQLIELGAPAGLFGPKHFWLLSNSITSWVNPLALTLSPNQNGQNKTNEVAELFRFEPDSPQAKALQGMAIVTAGVSQRDAPRLTKALRETISSSQQQQENPHEPRSGRGDFGTYFQSKSPFASEVVQFPSNLSSLGNGELYTPGYWEYFAYDAVMTLGLAACRAMSSALNATGDGSSMGISGRDVLDQLSNVSFVGASGPLTLDPATLSRQPNSTTYVVLNTLRSEVGSDGKVGFDIVTAGEYSIIANHSDGHVDEHGDAGNHSDQVAMWRYTDGVQGFNYSCSTMVPPPSLPRLVQNNAYDNGGAAKAAYILFTAVGVLLMMTSLGFAAWTFRYRKSYVIRASQPGFLMVLCVGVFFMALSIVTLAATHYLPTSTNGDDDDGLLVGATIYYNDNWANASCMATHWFFNFGFGVSFSALFAKMWRINKILGNSVERFRRVVVQPRDVAVPGIIIVLGNLLITLIWQLVDPLRLVWVDDESGPVDQFGRPTDKLPECDSEEGLDVYFRMIIFCLNAAIIVGANFQAYRARNISTEFSESVYIAYAMGIILQALIISIPVFFYDGASGNAAYIAQSIIYVITVSTMILLIFVPKVGFWLHRKRASELRRVEKEELRLRHGPPRHREFMMPGPSAIHEEEKDGSNSVDGNGDDEDKSAPDVHVATFSRRPSSLTLARNGTNKDISPSAKNLGSEPGVNAPNKPARPISGLLVLSSDDIMSSSYQTNCSADDLMGPVLDIDAARRKGNALYGHTASPTPDPASTTARSSEER